MKLFKLKHFVRIEIQFWNNRLTNLTQIYEQLRNERIHSMAMILEFTDSAYFPCFRTMFKNVVTGTVRSINRCRVACRMLIKLCVGIYTSV